VVLETALRLSPAKYDIHILCIRAIRSYRERYPTLSFVEIGGPLSDSPFFWLTFPFVQKKVHKELHRLRPKIVIAGVFPANWWTFIYKRFHKDVACIWYCHEPSAFIHIPEWIESITNPLMRLGAKLLNPVLKACDLFLARSAPDAVACNSKYTKTQYQRIYKKQNLGVIYPGVDLDVFFPQGKQSSYLLMVCRLTRFKNVHIALEAMARLEDQDLELVIGGEGEEKENLKALSEKLGISHRVRFLGRVSFKELPKLYSQAKLLLFTSENEPFGMVPVEALASGTPVVGTNSGGLQETVAHEQNGLLINDMTPENLADSIDSILGDSSKYNSLQKNTVQSAREFSWNNHVRKLEDILHVFTQTQPS